MDNKVMLPVGVVETCIICKLCQSSFLMFSLSIASSVVNKLKDQFRTSILAVVKTLW